jgi:hypothetical protein
MTKVGDGTTIESREQQRDHLVAAAPDDQLLASRADPRGDGLAQQRARRIRVSRWRDLDGGAPQPLARGDAPQIGGLVRVEPHLVVAGMRDVRRELAELVAEEGAHGGIERRGHLPPTLLRGVRRRPGLREGLELGDQP